MSTYRLSWYNQQQCYTHTAKQLRVLVTSLLPFWTYCITTWYNYALHMHEQYILQPTKSSSGTGNSSTQRQRIAEWSADTVQICLDVALKQAIFVTFVQPMRKHIYICFVHVKKIKPFWVSINQRISEKQKPSYT